MVILIVVAFYAFTAIYAPHSPQNASISSRDSFHASGASSTAASDLIALNETLTLLRNELKTIANVQDEVHLEHMKHVEGDKLIADLESKGGIIRTSAKASKAPAATVRKTSLVVKKHIAESHRTEVAEPPLAS